MPRTYRTEELIFRATSGLPNHLFSLAHQPRSFAGLDPRPTTTVQEFGSGGLGIHVNPPPWRCRHGGETHCRTQTLSTHSPCRIGSTQSGPGKRDPEFPASLGLGLAGEAPKGAICRASPMAAAAAAAVNEPRPKFTEVRGPPLSGESEMAGRVDRGAWHWGQNLGLVPFGIQERKLSWHAEASSSVP